MCFLCCIVLYMSLLFMIVFLNMVFNLFVIFGGNLISSFSSKSFCSLFKISGFDLVV